MSGAAGRVGRDRVGRAAPRGGHRGDEFRGRAQPLGESVRGDQSDRRLPGRCVTGAVHGTAVAGHGRRHDHPVPAGLLPAGAPGRNPSQQPGGDHRGGRAGRRRDRPGAALQRRGPSVGGQPATADRARPGPPREWAAAAPAGGGLCGGVYRVGPHLAQRSRSRRGGSARRADPDPLADRTRRVDAPASPRGLRQQSGVAGGAGAVVGQASRYRLGSEPVDCGGPAGHRRGTGRVGVRRQSRHPHRSAG